MQKITPFLWFDNQAEEAARFYTSIFKNSSIGNVTRYGKEAAQTSGRPAGTVMTVPFRLEGQEFAALNGGPMFQFNESISFVVNCETQKEIDFFWEKLSEGGQKSRCGWLKDKYCVSWQIVPTALANLISAGEPERANRVMQAIMQMDKLDIRALEQAYERQ
ncbi:MAG: VOC family protein [Acidobacteriaceae bacterium]